MALRSQRPTELWGNLTQSMGKRRPQMKGELTSKWGLQETQWLIDKGEDPMNLLFSLRAQCRLDILVVDKRGWSFRQG